MAVFRVQKTRDYTVMSNYHLRDKTLSLKSKGLLSLMLSLPEDWDYTLYGLSVICKDGLSSIRTSISELEGAGYLKRRRLRNGKGQLTDTEYTILEQPENSINKANQPTCDNPPLDKPILDKPVQGKPILENPTQLNIDISNTQKENTDLSSTNLSIPPARRQQESGNDVNDRIDMIESYREVVHENLDYHVLCECHGVERMDEIVELMVEILSSQRPLIRIAGDEYPTALVKNRLLKLDSSHIEYLFECFDKNTTKVRNIKGYLLASLFNAPITMDSYYRAEVNYDLYGGETQ